MYCSLNGPCTTPLKCSSNNGCVNIIRMDMMSSREQLEMIYKAKKDIIEITGLDKIECGQVDNKLDNVYAREVWNKAIEAAALRVDDCGYKGTAEEVRKLKK